MMATDGVNGVKVEFTPEFKRNVRRLTRRYPRLRADVEPLIEQLQGGETPGERIRGIGQVVYKVRVRNRDAQRGKSGGYRVIFYLPTSIRDTSHHVLEDDQSDIPTSTVAGILGRSR